jgi:putative phage-type endonuclease
MPKTYEIGNYTFIDKSQMTIEEWLDTRKEGVGGSDVGTILGTNPWQSALGLFYEKLNISSQKDLSRNDSIFWGRKDEASILDVSQYYVKSDPQAYMPNWENKKRVHTHLDFPYFIINNRMPWLQANVDGLGWSNSLDQTVEGLIGMMENGILPNPEKIIEIKTIKGRSRDRWIGGVPQSYVLQVLTYMMVCGDMNDELFGEIYSRVDGTELSSHDVPWYDDLMIRILEETREFQARIDAAREAIKGFNGSIDELFHLCLEFEPEPDSTEEYSKFYSEKELLKQAQQASAITTNDPLILGMCRKYTSLGTNAAELKGERQFLSNSIKEYMRKHETTNIRFEEGGKVSFNNRLYISI